MFVTKRKYKALGNEWAENYSELLMAFRVLQKDHNSLIDQINQKGGQAFLDRESSEFTPEEIKDLIVLCHPDKHGDSQKSVKLTQKLLNLRGESK